MLGVIDERVFAVAWVHDIGRVISDDNHAFYSLKLVSEKFRINNVIKDCILNHGSKSTALTPEGKMMQYADKLSMFIPEVVEFLLKEEGEIFQEKLHKNYLKAKNLIGNNVKVAKILEDLKNASDKQIK